MSYSGHLWLFFISDNFVIYTLLNKIINLFLDIISVCISSCHNGPYEVTGEGEEEEEAERRGGGGGRGGVAGGEPS